MTRMELLTPGWLTVSNDLPTGVHTISDTPPDDTACANGLEAIKAAKLLVLLELAAITPKSSSGKRAALNRWNNLAFLT